MTSKWDIEADVVVVGYGLAGATSAIVAHDAGAKVLLLEKLPVPGGNSLLAGGAIIFSTDVEDTIRYLRACSGGRVDEAIIEFMARGLVEVPSYVNQFAEAAGAVTTTMDAPFLLYPFPGRESFRLMRVLGFKGEVDAREAVQVVDMRKRAESTRRGGLQVMKMMFRLVEQSGVEVMLSTPAKRLVQDNEGRVAGLMAESKGQEIAIKTNKAVILACGGFEFNDWLKKQYLEIQPIYGVGCPGCTGDGILMSQKVGAALWHMWLIHGSYGFKFPEFRCGFRIPFGGALNPREPARVGWIVVNKHGKRFMNECVPFIQNSPYKAMQSINTDFLSTSSGLPEYTNIPCYMVFDEEGRKQGPIAFPLSILDEDRYEWSEDNMAEVRRGWIKYADTILELAEKVGVNPAGLKQALERWNSQCAEGKDTDFGRIPGSMVPIKNPPYYIVECWPVVTTTQGGPRFNSKCQIVDPYGEPIPGLYKAGELGSFYGHLYTLGGALAECIIEGRTAAENAVREPGSPF